ncbi:MAG: RluA family pseudouridine synthase [Treponema sp.]|nr:RluA family pseudouridine synthase [Treponema sp.]
MDHCCYSGTVENLPNSVRLDRYASEILGLLSRAQIKSRVLEAKLNGRPVKLSRPVKTGDRLELCWLPAAPFFLEPENIPLNILYEDERCAVINKSQGMIVHPGAGNPSGTLANALFWRRLNRQSAVQFTDEPVGWRSGIVHRLDKDTSGVLIAAYDDEALNFLSSQFKARTVKKRYLAIVRGTPEKTRGSILTRLIRDPRDRKRFTAIEKEKTSDFTGKGKIAHTEYRLIKSWGKDYALLLLKPRTGRTHQLRVHLKHIGHPILGDRIYDPQSKLSEGPSESSLMLHSYSLALVLPGEAGLRRFKAPVPEHFTATLAGLNNFTEA